MALRETSERECFGHILGHSHAISMTGNWKRKCFRIATNCPHLARLSKMGVIKHPARPPYSAPICGASNGRHQTAPPRPHRVVLKSQKGKRGGGESPPTRVSFPYKQIRQKHLCVPVCPLFGGFEPPPAQKKERDQDSMCLWFGGFEPPQKKRTSTAQDHRDRRLWRSGLGCAPAGRASRCDAVPRVFWGASIVHLLKTICYFPLLILKGIYHYWEFVSFSWVLNQMEETCMWPRGAQLASG